MHSLPHAPRETPRLASTSIPPLSLARLSPCHGKPETVISQRDDRARALPTQSQARSRWCVSYPLAENVTPKRAAVHHNQPTQAANQYHPSRCCVSLHAPRKARALPPHSRSQPAQAADPAQHLQADDIAVGACTRLGGRSGTAWIVVASTPKLFLTRSWLLRLKSFSPGRGFYV